MYAMLCTCPDICYVVGLVSRSQRNQNIAHWVAIKRLLHYLEGTKDWMLCYQGGDLTIVAYTNSSFSDDPDDGKTICGYIFLLGGGAIFWTSKKQESTVMSTMEAEYVGCVEAAIEAV